MLALSVVTPSYDMARFLPETLDSVGRLATSHEHIVIDGGSTDGTIEILKERGDPALRWSAEPDRGQTHAVNKAFGRAAGEFVGWLNADDAYVPEAVDRAVEHLAGHSETAAVFGSLDVVDESGALQRSYQPGGFDWRWYLWLGDYVPTPTIIFRRELLDETGLLDERWHDAADYDFYLRLLRGRRVDRMDDCLVRFRYHAASKTGRDQTMQQDEALAIRLRWARGARDAAVMRALDATKRAAYRLVSPYPPNRHVAAGIDRLYALRETWTRRNRCGK